MNAIVRPPEGAASPQARARRRDARVPAPDVAAFLDRIALRAPGSPAAPGAWRLGAVPFAAVERAVAATRLSGRDPWHHLAFDGGLAADDLYSLAAARYGLVFDPLDDAELAAPVDPEIAERATAALVLRGGKPCPVVAPRTGRLLGEAALLSPGTLVTTPWRLARLLRASTGPDILAAAVGRLAAADPDLSAATVPSPRLLRLATAAAAMVILSAVILPAVATTVLMLLGAVLFVAMGTLRLAAALSRARPIDPPPLAERDLPPYTVLVPLYREANMLPGLVRALDALDYPRDRLDIKIVLETGDDETLAEAVRLCRRPEFDIVTVPPGTPRTKPRALGYALAFARGRIVAVYDAEDRPAPHQLRLAAAALAAGAGDRLACVQARLRVDDEPGFLRRHFAAEYDALFTRLLPWLAEASLPLPLGGTSNHFARRALEDVGGWDPYNVTEDADLGIRLARYGWRTAMIPSETRENAPASLATWLRQRARWLKGWMITWIAHMRHPRALFREIGAGSFLAFNLSLAAAVGSALIHPIGLVLLFLALAGYRPQQIGASVAGDLVVILTVAGFAVGYGASMFILLRATRRRRGRFFLVLTAPVYWLMVSVAAWLALYELFARPHHWAKTPHDARRARRQ
jgi:cellulose synthase/poly-beta-1,6-N-acetylglucosamine synthase-like glycosyltransferase